MELRTMRISTGEITGKKKGIASNDIFEKCRAFTRPSELQAAGLYMYFEVFGERDGCAPGEVRLGKRKVMMFGSNDYLDLINHPKVKEAAIQAIRKYIAERRTEDMQEFLEAVSDWQQSFNPKRI